MGGSPKPAGHEAHRGGGIVQRPDRRQDARGQEGKRRQEQRCGGAANQLPVAPGKETQQRTGAPRALGVDGLPAGQNQAVQAVDDRVAGEAGTGEGEVSGHGAIAPAELQRGGHAQPFGMAAAAGERALERLPVGRALAQEGVKVHAMDLEDRVVLHTPEGVSLDVQLAGAASRFISGVLDLLVQLILIAILTVATSAAGASGGLLAAIATVGAFAIWFFYPVLFEVLAAGRTPGKRVGQLRVIETSGAPVDLADLARSAPSCAWSTACPWPTCPR